MNPQNKAPSLPMPKPPTAPDATTLRQRVANNQSILRRTEREKRLPLLKDL